MQSNYMTGDPLSLERIRSTLVRLEDTIIFGLIERAQFAHNPRIYEPGAFKELAVSSEAKLVEVETEKKMEKETGTGKGTSVKGSRLDWFLRETEAFHAKARRYTSPDEYPFTPLAELPAPVLPPLKFPSLLYPNTVNVNNAILELYVRAIVPRITHAATARRLGLGLDYLNGGNGHISVLNGATDVMPNGLVHGNGGNAESNTATTTQQETSPVSGRLLCGSPADDDGHYGSTATLDLEVLQALSKRVHYGKFVSESKFRSDPAAFVGPIRTRDREALAALITKPEVERRLLQRVRNKARLYGQEVDADGRPLLLDNDKEGEGMGKIDVESVVALYEHHIIPLTKEVEVDYLLQRLDGLSEADIDALCGK